MSSPPKPMLVDWTTIKIWCCGEYLHIDDIAGHAEQKHSSGEKVVKNNENLHIGDRAGHAEQKHSNGEKVDNNNENLHIGDRDGHAEQKHSNAEKVYKNNENLHIGDSAGHAEYVHSYGEKALNDEPSEKKMKLQQLTNVEQNNENYNFVVSNKKFENSKRINDKFKDNSKYYCDSCEYTTARKYNLRIHKENKHLGIRHLCEVCQFRSTSKAGLNRHIKRIHAKTEMKQEICITDTLQKIALETSSFFQNGLNDAQIKQEVIDPMFQENITATNVDVAITKQEIVSEAPTLLSNQMVSVAVDVLTEVKEEVDEENLQVPGWRIFPEFEFQSLNKRKKALAEGKTKKLDNVFLEEQAAIEKLHSKLEKKEKNTKKWDAQWRKRLENLQKLKADKDKSSGKDMIKEEEEIEVFCPNPDYVTDLIVYDVGQEPLPS